MKIKDKIRDKLRQWLFSEELLKFESAEQNYKDAEDLYNRARGYLNAAKDEYSWSFKMVDDCHQLMNSMMDVGTDVGFLSTGIGILTVTSIFSARIIIFQPPCFLNCRGYSLIVNTTSLLQF